MDLEGRVVGGRPRAHLGARPSPRRLPPLRRRRGRAHARADGHRPLVRPRRAALRPLPDALCSAARSGWRPYATFGTPELAESVARRARGPDGGADGKSRRDRARRRRRPGGRAARCCSNGHAPSTGTRRRSAPRALSTPISGDAVIAAAVERGYGTTKPVQTKPGARGRVDERRDDRDRDGRARPRRAGAAGRGDPGGPGRPARGGDPRHGRRAPPAAPRSPLRSSAPRSAAPARSAPTRSATC